MNQLKELIKKLCPNGVKCKQVKDCFKRLKGTSITAGKMKEIGDRNGTIKVFAGGKTVINANEKDIPNANIVKVPAVLVQSRGVVDFIYYEKPFTFKNEMWAYTANDKVEVKYLYYVFKNSVNFFKECAAGRGSLPQISLAITEEFKIPLPPIEVQREIVRILDNFTELTAELTARKKQYNYFCNKLLTQSNQISYIKVKDLARFVYGFTDKAKDSGNVRYIRITDIDESGRLKQQDKKFLNLSENNRRYLLKKGDLVMARTGATFGKTLYFDNNEPAIYASFLIKIELSSNRILNRFYWHFSKTSLYWDQANNLVSTGGQPQFNTGAIGNVIVPVPPLEEQKRIVAILDRFDKLCNDLSEGLPAEIEARQKQCEYYRDKLLTFKEKAIGG